MESDRGEPSEAIIASHALPVNQNKETNLQSLLDTILHLQQEDKLFKAHEELKKLELAIQELKSDQVREEWKEELQRNECLHQLREEIEEVQVLLEDFNSLSTWTLMREIDGIKTYYRHESSTPIHSIRLEGIIDSPIFNVLSIIYEADLYVNWWPMLKEVQEMEKISKFRKLVYLRADSCWPLAPRDVVLYGYGVDMLEEDETVVIMVRSEREGEFQNTKPIPSGAVRMECKFGGMLAKPISSTQTKVILLSNADPKMSFLPNFALNLVVKKLSHHMFQMLRQQAKKIEGSEYEQRIQENDQVYGEARRRLEGHFKRWEEKEVNWRLESL